MDSFYLTPTIFMDYEFSKLNAHKMTYNSLQRQQVL